MLSLSPIKILIILIVALLVVGPEKLPQIARQVGGAWKAFRSLSSKVEEEVRSSIPDLPSSGDLARYARSPSTLLDRLAGIGNDHLAPDPGAPLPVVAPQSGLTPDPGAPNASVRPPEPAPPSTTPRPPLGEIDPSLN